VTAVDEDFLRTFYQHLKDRPLEPDDRWYVPLYQNQELNSTDPVARLARCMLWEALPESTQLFSGFRGTGKSTELLRLRKQLTARGFVVVLCDMRKYLNLSTPIDISDFLLSAAGAVSDALAEDPDLLGQEVAGRGYWQRFSDFLHRIEFTIGGVQATGQDDNSSSTLKVGLKQDPSFREVLQKRMKGHIGALVHDVRAFMADCVQAVQRKHGNDTNLVILFDSIEQIRGTSHNDSAVFRSVETLFANHADKLRFPDMHVVYTVPPWLKIRSPGVNQLYDGGFLLPCVKVREQDGSISQPGIVELRKLVRQRGDWTRVFANESDLDHVLLKTGGYLRDLFRALQGILMRAADQGKLPVDRKAIDLELDMLRNGYLPIANADATWLAKIARSHEAELPQHAELPDLSRYFDTHLLLCYRNGKEWYDIHPLIRETVERAAKRASQSE